MTLRSTPRQRQDDLLAFLYKVGVGLPVQLTTSEISEKVGMSVRTVERAITGLRQAGKIEVSTHRFRLLPNSWVNRRTILVKE